MHVYFFISMQESTETTWELRVIVVPECNNGPNRVTQGLLFLVVVEKLPQLKITIRALYSGL